MATRLLIMDGSRVLPEDVTIPDTIVKVDHPISHLVLNAKSQITMIYMCIFAGKSQKITPVPLKMD
jgi:hypothetical protein